MNPLENIKLCGEKTCLISMTRADLEDQRQDPGRTALKYGLQGALETPDDAMSKILDIKLGKMAEAPELAVFSTYFLIVSAQTSEILGTIGFKGAPDEDGTIEVGYGIRPEFRSRGYMTEALRTLTTFGLTLPGVEKIVACTSKDNAASIRVLEKVGYLKIYTGPDLYVWQFEATPEAAV